MWHGSVNLLDWIIIFIVHKIEILNQITLQKSCTMRYNVNSTFVCYWHLKKKKKHRKRATIIGTNVSRIDKPPLKRPPWIIHLQQKRRVETLTLFWHKPDLTVYIHQLKRSTFDPRAGDNVWLNVSRLVWLQILQCSKCFRAPQALSTNRDRAEKQLREKREEEHSQLGGYSHQLSKVD